jgi:perosamine synthetase|tara:strand:- start:20920 stop:22056 length:1137 start_codon:yes stop_codon:yes gene_type:complete
MKYPLNIPSLSPLEKKYVNQALKDNWLSINGKNTKIFEDKFSKQINRKFSVAVQSGTAALHTVLRSLGVKDGDNVIVPDYTCVSNLSATSQCRANAIMVDLEKDTLGLDYEKTKLAINKYKPKALQLVHVYGFPARDTLKIINLCKKKKIYVIEDASESLGATINKKKVGSFGDVSIFSVRSEKMIGVGEGGVISTSNKKLFERIKFFASRNSPYRAKKDPYWKKYYSIGEGYNYLMPHLLGSIARAQIERFKKDILVKKIKVGQIYRKIFKSDHFDFTQKIIPKHKPVFWLNSIYFKKISKKNIQKIGYHLMKDGIEVRSGFWPLHQLPNFLSQKTKIKNSIDIFNNTIVLPSSLNLKEKDIKFIYKRLLNLIEIHK